MTPFSVSYVLLAFLGLLITQEIFHRYARFSLWFFSIASIIFFPCWILLIGVEDWFAWLKVLSVAIGIIVLSVLRTTNLGNTKWCQWIVYVFLVVNILEAITKDVISGSIANYLNAIAGFLLVATLSKIQTIHIDKKFKDLHWGSMTLSWIIGYTLWNWVFVYLNYGFQSSILHIAVLESALVVAFVDKERWLQARVFTLGTYFMMMHAVPHLDYRVFTGEYNESFGLMMAMLTFGLMLAYTAFFMRGSAPRKLKAI